MMTGFPQFFGYCLAMSTCIRLCRLRIFEIVSLEIVSLDGLDSTREEMHDEILHQKFYMIAEVPK